MGNVIKTIQITELNVNPEAYQVWGEMTKVKYEQFLEDIKENGVRDLVHVDEGYTILDGHHRYKAAVDLGIVELEAKIHKGLSDDEKLEIAHKSNSLRNDISKKKLKERAVELRKQGRGYRQIGRWLGVHHTSVMRWCGESAGVADAPRAEGSDGKEYPAEKPSNDELTERRQQVKVLQAEGKRVPEIAKELGVSERTVYNDIKVVQKDEVIEDKRNRRRKHEQSLDVAAYEVKTREDLYPDFIEGEPEYSANNILINARKKITALAINSAMNYDRLKTCDENVRKAYIREAKTLAKSLLISVGGYCSNSEYEEIIFVILELLEKINLEEDIFNE